MMLMLKPAVSLAEGLLEYETLSGEEINDILAGKPPVREDVPEAMPRRSAAVPRVRDKKAEDKTADNEADKDVKDSGGKSEA